MLFLAGLIGGCAGSTGCAIKIFRLQLLFAATVSQVRQIVSPRGIFHTRYDNRPVGQDIISSVMAFFVLFVITLFITAAALGMAGLDTFTAVSAATTSLANVGAAVGPELGPTGDFARLPNEAKWIMMIAMLVGRLELMSVFVLFTVAFWRG